MSEPLSVANDFLNKLAALSKLAARLTRSANLDELCRDAIALGCQELGFDRLGLWFSNPESDTISGTYGTDEVGNVRDEHSFTLRLSENFPLVQAICRKERYAYETDITISTLTGTPMANGWKATAALWDGEEIIGYLFTDNLLQRLPYSDHMGELLALYALLLGHLCSRQRAAEAAREREARYRALIDAIPDYLFVITSTGQILDFQPARPSPVPQALTEMSGKSVREILHTKLAERYMQAIEGVLQTGKMVTVEHSLRYGDTLHHFETRIAAVDKDKVMALARDVTDRKRLEEQLYISQKIESLGRMASGIAHDFNNLLTVIQGFATVAENQAVDGPPKLRKALTHIHAASEKGANLTSQLLLFARKQVVQPTIVDVNSLIYEMETILILLLGKDMQLHIDLASMLGQVRIDVGQFEQVIINLAANARDAMPDGGQLTIRTRQLLLNETEGRLRFNVPAGEYVLIELHDTGVGIDEALQKQIFEPFFTTKELGKGTGLGLAICHSIVQQSGGQLQVQSAPNQGTTFQILLPQTRELPTLIPQSSPPTLAPSGSETILLVEDDEPVRAVAVEILSSYGYVVLACATGAEALQTASDYPEPINLLMTDMRMPKMNGREVAEQFMHLRPHVPVLLVSGYVDELPSHLVNQPNVTFLPKPYTLPLLTKTVRTILDQHPVLS